MEIPITWGYLLLALALALAPFVMMARGRLSVPRSHAIALALMAPFAFLMVSKTFLYGVSSAGILASNITNFVIIPFGLFFFFNGTYGPFRYEQISRVLAVLVACVCVYGIFLFFYSFIRGEYFTIPYLTANASDVADNSITTKPNLRRFGSLAINKLISTYNNGNIFGVCILMILPLAERSKVKPWWRILVYIALFLTLSRTVWFGIFAYLLIKSWWQNDGRIAVSEILNTLLIMLLVVFIFYIGFSLMGVQLSWLFDSNLGGRAKYFNFDLRMLPTPEPVIGFLEIVYLGVLHQFGVVGLVLFLIYMSAPILARFMLPKNYFRHVGGDASALLGGMLIYLFISLSDGAINLIPIMLFYMSIAALYLAPRTR